MQTIQCADIKPFETDNFILVGPPGGGKSALAGTMPGKTIAICFDVSARATYQLFSRTNHITIVEYLKGKRDLTPYTTKDMKTRPALAPGQTKETAKAFLRFGEELNKAVLDGFIPGEFQNILIDSTTSLQELALTAVMEKKGRAGEVPGISDYENAKQLVIKVFDSVTELEMNSIFIIHDEVIVKYDSQGQVSNVIRQPVLIGNLKSRLPTKMNHLFRCTAQREPNNTTKYLLQTKPNAHYNSIRTSFQGLSADHDVTIGDFSRPFDYGLAKIIKEQKNG